MKLSTFSLRVLLNSLFFLGANFFFSYCFIYFLSSKYTWQTKIIRRFILSIQNTKQIFASISTLFSKAVNNLTKKKTKQSYIDVRLTCTSAKKVI